MNAVMTQTESFYNELAQRAFCVTAEILMEEELVHIYYFKNKPEICGKNVPLSEMTEYLEKVSVPDSISLPSLSLESLKKTCLDGCASKSICFQTEEKSNVIKRYVLALYPVSAGKILATVKEYANAENEITLKLNKSAVSIKTDEIIYVDYGNHSVDIHTSDGDKRFFSVSFGDVAEILFKYDNFIRSYKNCIVNMDKVVKIENDAFLMEDGNLISIPQRRCKKIRTAYTNYLFMKSSSDI